MSREAMEGEKKIHSLLLGKVLKLLATAQEIHDSYQYTKPPTGICEILDESKKHPLPSSYPDTTDSPAALNAEIQIVADMLYNAADAAFKRTAQAWFNTRYTVTHEFYLTIQREILPETTAADTTDAKSTHP
ncbi:MAG: hypothetical protein P1U34_03375 [Coxiellaceae bacterium]|nr:hypothetical protein [Coxiellaceae bacterium]